MMHLAWMPRDWKDPDLDSRTTWCREHLPEGFWFTTRAVRNTVESGIDGKMLEIHDTVFCFFRHEDWMLFRMAWE